MSVNSRNGRLEYRFMFRGQDIFQATGLEDTARNRKAVADMEAARRQQLREGALGIQKLQARSFIDAFDAFLLQEATVRRSRINTWKRIKTSGASLKLFFGKKTLYLLTEGDIDAYKIWRLSGDDQQHISAVKSVTVRHDLDNLSLFLQWAKRQNLVRTNLVDDVEKPLEGDSQRMYILSVDEERQYFSFLQRRSISENGNLHDVGRLMIQQGLRPEEALTIEKSGVDLERRSVKVSKSKSNTGLRTLKLTSETWQLLARRISSEGPWIFPSSRRPGAHITKLNCPHDRAMARLGMNWVLYDLRHTFATRFIESGGDLATLKDIMGHRDIRTTMRYVHVSQHHQFQAMEHFEKSRLALEKNYDGRQLPLTSGE